VRKLIAALAIGCAALIPPSAPATLIVGINDDVKYEAFMPAFFMPTMQADGLKMNALTIRWDETQPTAIDPDLQDFITQVVGAAATSGVTVEFDLYPLHSQALTGGQRCPHRRAPSRAATRRGSSSSPPGPRSWRARPRPCTSSSS
jgi:hypothetical protein